MSLLDPGHAKAALGFAHRPLGSYLDSMVASFLARHETEPPAGYRHRNSELQLV
jgi:hypothetical protein